MKMDSEEEEDSGTVQAGLVMGVPKSGDRKAHQGPSRMEAAMDKYHKQTAELHRKQDAENAARRGPDASNRISQDHGCRAASKRIVVRRMAECCCPHAVGVDLFSFGRAEVLLGLFDQGG